MNKVIIFLLGLLPYSIWGQGLYQEDLSIPVYDPQNNEMLLITTSSADSIEMLLNDPAKRIFFIQPGDYTDERIEISSDGTSSAPKWLIYYDPQNPTDYTTHPVNMDPSDCATFQRMNLVGAYWIFDRIRSVGDGTRNPSISLLDDYIILNRCLIEFSGGGAGQIAIGEWGSNKGPSNYGVIQNCVIRNTQISVGDDNHGIKIERGDYNRIVHNEIYNFAGDGIQFGLNYGPFKGTVIYDNDIYIDVSKYHLTVTEIPHENGIDIKYGGGSGLGEHTLIKNNRFRNLSHTPGGTSPNLDQGAIDHSNDGVYKSYELIEDNIFYDCRTPINTKGGDKTDHFTIRRNLIYKPERFAIWMPKVEEHHHDIYLNTIIDIQELDGDEQWYFSRAENSQILGNVVINGGTPSDETQSGTISDYNAFYNTDSLDFEGSHSISYGSDSDANNTSFTFSMGMFTGPVSYTIPNAQPTSNSPHINLTSGITFGSTSGVGYNNNDTYTQNWAGAIAPSTNGYPPVVNITDPSNGEEVDSTITLVASASDPDNDLVGVQFKINGVNLGSEITSSPYSVTWNTTNESEGSHVIAAVARDYNNNTSTATVSVVVDNVADVAPVVSITHPSNQSTVNDTVTITASATDDNNDLVGVQFKLDGSNLGPQDNSFPFSYNWNTANTSNGSHILTAVAVDSQNNITTSTSISVNVSNGTEECVILPNTNTWVNTGIGSLTDDFTIEYDITPSHLLNAEIGLSLGDVSSSNDVAALIKLSSGKIQARDNQGFPSTNILFSAGNTYHIKMDVDLTNHTYDVFANEAGNAATQIADDNAFHSNSSSITELNRLSAVLISTNSGYQLDVCNIELNCGGASNTPPSIAISSPSDGAEFTVGDNITINVTATDGDGSVADVEFFNGSTSLGTDNSAPFSLVINNASAGSYNLTAVATDDDGASTTSDNVSVTVSASNQPPIVSITSPSDGAEFTVGDNITINVTASDGDGSVADVEFFNGSTSLGTDNSAPFSLVINNASAGSYIFTADATDDDGASTTSDTVLVMVSSTDSSECIVLPNTNTWVNTGIGSLTDDFTIEYDITPSHLLNAEIGLSLGDVSSSNDVAALIKLSSGKIQARDNQGFPSTNIHFSAGNTYHIKMDVDLTNHTYDVFANEAGSAATQIADDNAFHSNSSSISELNRLSAVLISTNSGYQLDICNISISNNLGGKSLELSGTIGNDLPILQVYPNPIGDFINIDVREDISKGRYILSTISGVILDQGIIPGSVNSVVIHTSHLNTGVYILNLKTEGRNSRIVKLIKY